MSEYQAIKAATNAYIKTNGRQEITGNILNAVMIATIDSLGRFYQFAGRAIPSTNPGDLDQNVAYIAGTPGEYTHLGGYAISPGEVAVFKYNGSWTMDVIVTIPARVSDLANDVGFITNAVSDLVNYYTRDDVDNLVSASVRQSYVVAWDGASTPVVSQIPAGVVVTYGGTPYTGTLPASENTLGKIYLVNNGGGNDMYATSGEGAYSWFFVGTTNIDLTGYATSAQVDKINTELDIVRPFFVTKTEITDFSGYTKQNFVILSAGTYGTTSSSKHIEIPVKPGQRVRIHAHATNGTRVAFYWDFDSPANNAVLPSVPINGNPVLAILADEAVILDVPDGAVCLVLNTGSSTTPYTPQSVIIAESLVASAESQLVRKAVKEGANLEDPDTLKNYWTIDSRNGRVLRQSSSTKGITPFIPVEGGDLYCNNRTDSGTYGRSAVYDIDKNFIRSFNTNQYTYVEGDGYVRFTIDLSSTQKVITRRSFVSPRPMSYYAPLIQKMTKDSSFIVRKVQVPDLYPASGLVGEPGEIVTSPALTDDLVAIDAAPKKLKPNVSLSFYGKVTSFDFLELGCGRLNNTGWGLRITATNVSAVSYNGGSAVIGETKAHGLIIGTFIYVAVVKSKTRLEVKVTSFGGQFVDEVNFSLLEAYGTPFAYANSGTYLEDVKFGWVSKDLKKPIWFFGASYCSLYNSRMLTQLINTYGVDNFAIIAQAGDDFSDIWASLTASLNYGTPKYLVCCIGMNTAYPATYYEYMKRLEIVCGQKGIELILCTIPYPENGTKEGINNIVRASGHRYIDLYASVSSDDQGTWYPGYCDDGVHPTLIGAKAMAARIMLDLQEILDY